MSVAPELAHCHPRLERVRVTSDSTELQVRVVRGVGWRAVTSMESALRKA